MARATYSDETKAQVMAALLTGQSINAVAREYKIPKQTISNWKNRDKPGVPRDDTQKAAEIEDLLSGYLKENLKTLRAQAEFFREETWLKKQEARSERTFHRSAVLSAVLSAVAAPEQAERQPDPVGSACIPISHTARIDSLETRTATLETQQNWLHLEQLRSEVGGLRETMQYLIDYLAERDGGGAG